MRSRGFIGYSPMPYIVQLQFGFMPNIREAACPSTSTCCYAPMPMGFSPWRMRAMMPMPIGLNPSGALFYRCKISIFLVRWPKRFAATHFASPATLSLRKLSQPAPRRHPIATRHGSIPTSNPPSSICTIKAWRTASNAGVEMNWLAGFTACRWVAHFSEKACFHVQPMRQKWHWRGWSRDCGWADIHCSIANS